MGFVFVFLIFPPKLSFQTTLILRSWYEHFLKQESAHFVSEGPDSKYLFPKLFIYKNRQGAISGLQVVDCQSPV